MSRSFLIVLPKLMRSGAAPAASACSISGTLAQSKQEPSRAKQVEDLRRRIRLHRVEDARIRQSLGEAHVVFAHDVEIDDEARAVFGIEGEEFLDAIGHSGIPRRDGVAPKTRPGGKSAMRPPARAVETREAVVDPPTATPSGPVAQAESRSRPTRRGPDAAP